MASECSICLGHLKEPVSIPCGHIYCRRCLKDYVNNPANEEGTSSSCPTCRAKFITVVPDLNLLPRKYHPYIIPAIRRIYVDESTVALQAKLDKAEKQIRTLQRGQEQLLHRNEQSMAAIRAHQQGEREATEALEVSNRSIRRLTALSEENRNQIAALRKANLDLAPKLLKLSKQLASHEQQTTLRLSNHKVRRPYTLPDSGNAEAGPSPSSLAPEGPPALRARHFLRISERTRQKARSVSPSERSDLRAKRPRLSGPNTTIG